MTTYHRLAASVVLGAAIAASLIHAPVAHADSSDFLDAAHDLGWYSAGGGDVRLLDNGYLVCRLIGQGYPASAISRQIYANTDSSVTASDANEFVIISVENLCSQYDHRSAGAAA